MSADDLGFHSASALVETIVDRLRTEGVLENQEEYHKPEPNSIPVPPPPNVTEQASAATQNPPSIQEYMTQITQQMATLQAQLTAAQQLPTNGSNRTPQQRPRNDRRTRDYTRDRGRVRDRQPRPRNGGKYCHTHGNCAHISTECNTPGSNHVTTATFSNMQGGSILNCV